MRRLIATVLAVLALAGDLIPLALAATTAPHSCCIRKAHKCHQSVSESAQLAVRSISSCNHDCCRALTTYRWASPQSPIAAAHASAITGRVAHPIRRSSASVAFASLSTRAPPAC